MRILYHPKKVILGFFPFVAPADFDRTAQPVDIYTVFKAYFKTNANAKFIYSFTSSINTLSLSAKSGVSYRWGETIGGIDYVYDISSGTAFTAGSTNRYVIVKNTSSSMGVALPNGAVWLYLGHFIVNSLASTYLNYYLKYIHAHDLNDIVSLSSGAFRENRELEGILTIPDHFTSIPQQAFWGCVKLTGSLVIPNSCTTLGAWCFMNTRFTSVDLGGVINMGGDDFADVITLTTVNLRSVQKIEWQSFYGCKNLAETLSTWIPSSCNYIGHGAFYNCIKLNGVFSLPDTVTKIQYQAFYGCTGLTGSCTIEDTVTEIGYLALYNCTGLTGQLTIPASVTTIGEGAFGNCNFSPLVTYSSTIVLDDHVLYDISSGVVAIHSEKSYNGTLTFRTGTTKVGNYCFLNNLRTGGITILASTTSLGTYIFGGCAGFTGNLTIPDTVTSISESALRQMLGTLGNLTFGTGVPALPAYVCEGSSGFKGTLTLPSNCTNVGYMAFEGCSGFTGDLIIPASITTITASREFRGMKGLNGKLQLNAINTAISGNTFDGVVNLTALELPSGYVGTANAYSLVFNFSTKFSAASLNTSLLNITDGTSGAWKTFTIGATNKERLLAAYPTAETDANARYIYVT